MLIRKWNESYMPFLPATEHHHLSLILISRPTEGRRLSWPGWLGEILRWFARPKMVTHTSTNLAQCGVTSLKHPLTLLLHQTTTVCYCTSARCVLCCHATLYLQLFAISRTWRSLPGCQATWHWNSLYFWQRRQRVQPPWNWYDRHWKHQASMCLVNCWRCRTSKKYGLCQIAIGNWICKLFCILVVIVRLNQQSEYCQTMLPPAD